MLLIQPQSNACLRPDELTAAELQAVGGGLSPLGIVSSLVKGPPAPAPRYDRDLEDLEVER